MDQRRVATFFLVTGHVVLLLELDLFGRNRTSTAVYRSGEISAKRYVICKRNIQMGLRHRWWSYKYKVRVKSAYFKTVNLRIWQSGKPICGWQVTKQLGPLWSQRSKLNVAQGPWSSRITYGLVYSWGNEPEYDHEGKNSATVEGTRFVKLRLRLLWLHPVRTSSILSSDRGF